MYFGNIRVLNSKRFVISYLDFIRFHDKKIFIKNNDYQRYVLIFNKM